MENTEENNLTIQWVEDKLHLKDLRPYERNPRTITECQFEKLLTSLKEDGYHARIKVTHDKLVIGGHQRIKALKHLYSPDTLVPVLVPSRELTEEEYKRIMLRDNHNYGLFDMDILGNDFDLDYLKKDIGLHELAALPPIPDESEQEELPKNIVRCPSCTQEFPVKGNKV